MTTFTLINSESDFELSANAVVNMNAVGSTDNILIAIVSERSGVGEATHTVSDGNGTWTQVLGEDQELGDSGARQSASLWWRKAVSADTSGAFDITGATTAASEKRLSVYEVDPSAAYDWTFQVESSANTGTGSTSPLSSGSTSNPGGSDLFVFGLATWRIAGASPPASIALTNLDSGVTSFAGGGNTHAIEFSSTGESAGAKETEVSWTGAGNEAICGIAVFSDGVIGGGASIMNQIQGANLGSDLYNGAMQ